MDSVTVAISATRLTAFQTHRCLQEERLKTGGRTALLFSFGMNVLLKFLLMSLFESPEFGRVMWQVFFYYMFYQHWLLESLPAKCGRWSRCHKRVYGKVWLEIKSMVKCYPFVYGFGTTRIWKHTVKLILIHMFVSFVIRQEKDAPDLVGLDLERMCAV